MRYALLTTSLVAGLTFAGGAFAKDLPSTMAWTAYDVGSSGYNQAVAIGAALKNKKNVTLRVLPGKNDVSRLVPLRENKVDFSAFGIGGYQALEAVFTFGQKDWGPQPLRMLSMSNSDACNTLMLAGDLGITSYKDLKGKRMPVVKGAPALNQNVYAYLRFAGLEWSDVKTVEFGGYGASMDAVVEGQVDGAITITSSGFATKIAAGPRGYYYAPVPHDDEAGWKRMHAVAPYFFKSMCSEGAGIKEPFEAASYPYPILIAYENQDEGMVYAMTAAMYELYPEYKDSAPGAKGWALDRQVLSWVLPFHPGAVRYYKEKGVWGAAEETHQQDLLSREKLLRDAWKDHVANAKDPETFEKGWMKVRADVLSKAGLNPIWTEW